MNVIHAYFAFRRKGYIPCVAWSFATGKVMQTAAYQRRRRMKRG